MADDALRDWLATPDWDTSREFLETHPILLDADVPGMLIALTGGNTNTTVAVHLALLTLASDPDDVESAYGCLTSKTDLEAVLSQALAALNPGLIQACAVIEAVVQGNTFSGIFHLALAQLIGGQTLPASSRNSSARSQVTPAQPTSNSPTPSSPP